MPINPEILRMGLALRRVESPRGTFRYIRERQRNSKAKLKDLGTVELEANNKLFLALLTGKINKREFLQYLANPEVVLKEGECSRFNVKFSYEIIDEEVQDADVMRIMEGFDIERLIEMEIDPELMARNLSSIEFIAALLRNPALSKIYLTFEHCEYLPEDINDLAALILAEEKICGITINNDSISQLEAIELLEGLATKRALEVLGIKRNGFSIGDRGLRAILAIMTQCDLHEITLDGAFVSGLVDRSLLIEMMNMVAESSSLRCFDFSNNKILASEVPHIANVLRVNSSIRDLNLVNCRLQDVGMKMIGDALQYNQTLKTFNCAGNDIGDLGAVAMALAIRENLVLERLDLGAENAITALGRVAISEAVFISNEIRRGVMGIGCTPLAVTGVAAPEITQDRRAELRLEAQRIIDEKLAAKAAAQKVQLRDEVAQISKKQPNCGIPIT